MENQEYSVSVQHSASLVTMKIARLLRWMPVKALIPTGLPFVEHAHYPVSLHINLYAGGDAGWVNFVMHCSQKWACVFHFVFHVPALPWVHLSFEAAPRIKEPRLPACVCASVRGRKWARETVKQQELRTKSLWSCWSVANVLHLFVRTSEVPLQV